MADETPERQILDNQQWFADREAVFMTGAGSAFGRAALRYQSAVREDRLVALREELKTAAPVPLEQ